LQLGIFATCQRANHKGGVLLGERYDKLVGFGFDFELEYARTSWEVRFQQLVDFQRQHGHFDVPGTNKALQRWVMIQRDQYRLKHKPLAGYILHKLQAIGFEWERRGATKKRVLVRR
jgi:hypothetical protein